MLSDLKRCGSLNVQTGIPGSTKNDSFGFISKDVKWLYLWHLDCFKNMKILKYFLFLLKKFNIKLVVLESPCFACYTQEKTERSDVKWKK